MRTLHVAIRDDTKIQLDFLVLATDTTTMKMVAVMMMAMLAIRQFVSRFLSILNFGTSFISPHQMILKNS